MRSGDAYEVFLSYSRADGVAAEAIRSRLKEAGLRAFLDRYGLPAGQAWQPWLEQHLLSCRALVVLVGPQGFGEWQQREIQLGLDRQTSAEKTGPPFPVIPVLLPGLAKDDIPVGRFLTLNTWVDLRKGLDEAESLQRLIAGVQGQPIDAAAAEKVLASISPYRGLLSFREQDAGLFFGRERFVDEIVQKVGQRTATNVVAVVGRSGSGKSSIVFGGLLPALRRERGLSSQSVWKIHDLRPHDEPLHQLMLVFNPPKDDLGPVDSRAELNRLANRFRNREVTLAELVRDRLRDEEGTTRLLLYVDQWEELYTQAAPREPKTHEDRARAADVRLFIDLVLEAAAKSPCTLVLSVRSDFYPDLQSHDGLRVAVQASQVSLGTMKEAELRALIEGPPEALGASVDPELTKKLIRDIGLDPASGRGDEYDIGKLPLLEYALEQAWAKRKGPQIGVAEYAGLEQALEDRANALYDRLSTAEQAAAKRLFVSLVTPGEGREDTRARIDMPDDAAMRMVINTFAGTEARLLVTDQLEGRRSVEVSHEALIRHWKELRQWIDANRDNLRTRARLKEDRAEWLKRDKAPELLGIPNQRLKEVQKLSDEPGDVRIDDIKDFIDALLDHDQRRLKAEAAKLRAELDAARRRAWVAAAAAVLLLLAAVFAGREAWVANDQRALAVKQTEEAKKQSAIAETQTVEAKKQKEFADGQQALADKQKAAAILNETHALAALSRAAAGEGRPLDGVELALAAWPRRNGIAERPMLGDAVRYLSLSFAEHPPIAVLSHGGAVNGALYSPDGRRILSWSKDKTLRLWDAATGAAIGEPLRHEDIVWGALYSPDGRRILSWSSDKTLRLWDAATGAAIGEPLQHEGAVIGAVYSPDGKRILSWSSDKTLRLWDVSWRSGDLFEIVCNYTPMMSSKEEMLRLSKRYGVNIGEPICEPGVKIPDPDWSRTEPAHAE